MRSIEWLFEAAVSVQRDQMEESGVRDSSEGSEESEESGVRD
jgi:hypothetical protein